MNRNTKRGFTIVELIIVIAVIAVLAAVLIPTFSGLIKNAQVARDESLVSSLNKALAMDTDNTTHKTMYQALISTAKAGYDVTKIKTTADGNEILWDSVNDCFVYLNKDESSTPQYIPNSKKFDRTIESHEYWAISDTIGGMSTTYSTYLSGDKLTEAVTATTGVDVGENTGITQITYSGEKSVIIRTNSFDTDLTVTSGIVDHYGDVAKANVNADMYNEYGNARVLTLTTGNVEVKSGAYVTLINAKDGSVNITGTVEALAANSGVHTTGNATTTVTGEIGESTVAIVGGEIKTSIGQDDLKNTTAIVLKDLNTDGTTYNLENCTIIGNMTKIKANVVAGNSNVTLKNIHTTDIGVGEEESGVNGRNVSGCFGKGFTGTLTFDGGKIDKVTEGTNDEDAPLYIHTNSQGNYVFKNMTLSTGATKGIKIKSAKSIVIENCVFDAYGLKPGATGNVWETRSLSAIDIDISNDNCVMDVTIKGCTFSNIPFSSTTRTDCTAGAIKIKSQSENGKFNSVTIENNTFINCCRDIVIGKAGSTYHTRTFVAETSAKWTIRNNTSTLTASSIANIEVKTAQSITKIGKMVGGCAVFDIADAYEDKATYAVQYN